jgi:hypothetical protein
MVAVYPSAIKTFTYREDYTELVEAADVNVSYDEIRAVQTTLGVSPQTETIDNSLKTYTNVSSRISAVRRGLENPYVGVVANNMSVAYNTDKIPSWNAKIADTHGMWNGGTNITCQRDGIYHFDFYIRWHRDNIVTANLLPTFDRNGKLQVEAQFTGTNSFITCQTDYAPVGFQDFIRQSCSITLPWRKGNSVYVRAYQSVYHAGNLIATAFATVTYQRDLPA